ncbi:alpha/beta fold hydrolase [Streptomyces sp. NPDC007172]|uniref:bifunctional 3-oxoadipate enol-lactonase/4-carboxymuconolactone decarboxylase PcaDC n=1 Tax=Streptomyces sp. NPDC007172 TaxID=3364776 RepID=UPI00369149D8
MSRPHLVLAPSLGTTQTLWAPQLPALSARFDVIPWDLPGHGDAPASALNPGRWPGSGSGPGPEPEPGLGRGPGPMPGPMPGPGPARIEALGELVLARLDALGVGRFAFAGVSLGAAVGVWLAAHHPERVESLALLCTSAHFGPPEPWAERAAAVRAGGLGAVADSAPKRWFTPGFPAPGNLLAEHHRVDPEAYAVCCEILAGLDLRPDLARITAPTLVLAGRDDTATPPPHARELADGIRDAQLVELPRAGHLATVERPRAVTEVLLQHFTRTHPDPLRQAGESARRAVLGDAHVDRAQARTTAFTARFQDFITRYAWGEIWGGTDGEGGSHDPGRAGGRATLDRRTRSVITLTALVAGGHKDELALHVKGALRGGLSPDEIADVLLQCAVYCSVPAANSAFAVAERAISEYEVHEVHEAHEAHEAHEVHESYHGHEAHEGATERTRTDGEDD